MLGFLPLLALAEEPIDLRAGLVITRSSVVRKAEYRIPSSHPDGKPVGAIRIVGDNITVDFQGATLRGTAPTTPPDRRAGTGIEVRGKNVVIKNARVHGYKNGLIAFDSPGIQILDSDFSYNWKQHLRSTLEREDLSDWMSYHQNDKDEWLLGNPEKDIPAYGGAIYLSRCNLFEVQGCRVTGGQNGLMVSRSNGGKVWNNDFSFLSSLGLGLYRSSENKVMHNKIDWCVRGYSHGVYNRGQDSAGILIYEQSDNNIFAYNSVTHGGDGFFLWAGQTTMDNGEGGCNDNLLYGNDFSHAPTNGIEATFSRNVMANNLLLECWHGIWGGYSYESEVVGNVFGLNAQAIAWEHGQDNRIRANVFHRDQEGIHLWMNPTQDPNWGYPKHRDTKSRDVMIRDNVFSHIATNAVRIKDTASVTLDSNFFAQVGKVADLSGTNPDLRWSTNTFKGTAQAAPEVPMTKFASYQVDPKFGPLPSTMKASGNPVEAFVTPVSTYLERFLVQWYPWPDVEPAHPGGVATLAGRIHAPDPLVGGEDPFLKPGALRGRQYILVDDWGPYDFRSPIAWSRGEEPQTVQEAGRVPQSARGTVHRLEMLGPKGAWKLVSMKGVQSVSAKSGEVPSVLRFRLPPGKAADVELVFEFVGDRVVSPLGVETPAGKPYRYTYRKFFLPIEWSVKWFAWDDKTDPRTQPDAFAALLAGKPIHSAQVERLDYAWWRELGAGLPADRFATLAEGAFEAPPGDYELQVTTDDGVRVWLDGKLVVADAWKYQGPTPYSSMVKLGGKHRLRVEHFEIDGFSTLQLRIVPKQGT